MFPIDTVSGDYNPDMLNKFSRLIAGEGFGWKIKDILPKVLKTGKPAGFLTAEGAALIDPEGDLEAGIPMCPPEGDAGTGMVATNSVRQRNNFV